ncbi:calcineurin-like phosphoesterase C-terminal domain-containing protein [Luteimonas aquatica]|uniref:calcineurin-like phosphoesterase C-terminal domain-containing protein n=1 Tax=Luteimonas aquatica TaxID=450364 RepID=UPI001F59B037|nr:calcineurin-like phosphoesterase family protein [Luteimonas aquatica]
MGHRFFCTCLLLIAAAAQAEGIGGTVYEDGNGNGRRDPGERGIAGVAVSNGREIVRTDAQGRYALQARAGLPVFVVKPAGWRVAAGAEDLPAFWREGPAGADFALRRAPPREGDLDVLVFADPQAKSTVDVDYYRRDIVEPLIGRTRAALGLSLGDIVNDDLSLYPAVNAITARLGLPWLHVAGNHDLDADARDDEDSLRTYRRHFGPDTYAWEEPQASFVLFDDVVHLPGEHAGYIGGLREDQLAFLEAYLREAPKDRLLVLGMHIPLFEPAGQDTFRDADRERLFALLRPFPKVLLLSGHSHTQRHYFHDARTGWHGAHPLHEYNVGAACGAFWGGVKDAQGIPDTTMSDGTPNGHATLRIGADAGAQGYALDWHPARLPPGNAAFTEAMALHAPKVLRRGAYPADGVYANVFMGRDDTRVEYRIDGGEWKPMRRVERPDPRVSAQNALDDAATSLRGYDRAAQATPSPHLWRGTLPTDLAIGAHAVEVRSIDERGREHRAGLDYALADAQP